MNFMTFLIACNESSLFLSSNPKLIRHGKIIFYRRESNWSKTVLFPVSHQLNVTVMFTPLRLVIHVYHDQNALSHKASNI